jgi:recombination protein RecA
MPSAVLPSDIVAQLTWRLETTPEMLPTGIGNVDSLIEGCPRGRITEIIGPASSGRTTLLCSILAEATRLGEYCAVVDAANAFDPASAARSGVELSRLIWIRCGGNAEHAMKAADLLIHSGGFGVIALDLCDVPPQITRRIPLSWWYRFRRAIENTPSVLLLLEREPGAKACASVLLEMKRREASFRGKFPFQYFEKARFEAASRKPMRPEPVVEFEVQALE